MGVIGGVSVVFWAIFQLIQIVVQLYSLTFVYRFIGIFAPTIMDNAFGRFVFSITEPFQKPVRKVLEGIEALRKLPDLSALGVLLIIWLVWSIVSRILSAFFVVGYNF